MNILSWPATNQEEGKRYVLSLTSHLRIAVYPNVTLGQHTSHMNTAARTLLNPNWSVTPLFSKRRSIHTIWQHCTTIVCTERHSCLYLHRKMTTCVNGFQNYCTRDFAAVVITAHSSDKTQNVSFQRSSPSDLPLKQWRIPCLVNIGRARSTTCIPGKLTPCLPLIFVMPLMPPLVSMQLLPPIFSIPLFPPVFFMTPCVACASILIMFSRPFF